MKENINGTYNISYFDFERIIRNIQAFNNVIDDIERCGLSFDAREFRSPTTDLMLLLSDIMVDKTDLIPKYCYRTDEMLEGVEIQDLWQILTEGNDGE